jgi:S-adenosylmethionine/arginine decarboxylase-like enzyme
MINLEFEIIMLAYLFDCKYLPKTKEEADKIAKELAEKANVHILNSSFQKYEGGGEGITALYPIKTSHMSITTYPEYRTASITLISCNPELKKKDKQKEIEIYLKRTFQPEDTNIGWIVAPLKREGRFSLLYEKEKV